MLRHRRSIRRLCLAVLVAALALLLVGGIVDRSWTAIALVVLMAGLLLSERRGRRAETQRVEPEQVPTADVRTAISTSPDRISAIKALREAHPGLGLKDAKDLVEGDRSR